MDILKLEYTTKWIEYNFLTEEILSKQNTDFEMDLDKKAEKYRYNSFVNWIKGKETFTNEEVGHYIELALEDVDKRMSGSAITDLFVSPKLTNRQFEMIRIKLPQFGEWSADVLDGPQSVIWDEAENRLHAQKGVLDWCMGGGN